VIAYNPNTNTLSNACRDPLLHYMSICYFGKILTGLAHPWFQEKIKI